MLQRDEIIRLAKFTGLRLHQQEKQYIQTIILKSIYRQVNPIFKGGTAMMMVYGLNRFSEDLDFTFNQVIDSNVIVENIVNDLRLLGIQSEISKYKQSEIGFSFRISAQGPLFLKEFDRCYISVDMSSREKILLPPEIKGMVSIYADILPFSYSVMQQEEIFAEKVRAICTRKKARDLFDLWFLSLKGVKSSVTIVNEKLKYYNKSFSEEEFYTRIESMRSNWETELQPFIIGNIPPFEQVLHEITQKGILLH